MTAKLRRSVSFSDDIITHEVPPVEDDEKTELFYTDVDIHRFKVANRLRKEKRLSKKLRKLVEETKDIEMKTMSMPQFEMVEENGIMVIRQVIASPTAASVSLENDDDPAMHGALAA